MEEEEGSLDRGQGTCGRAQSIHCAGRPCRRLRQLPRTSRRLIIFVALNETSFLLGRSCLFGADPSSMPQSVGSDTKAQGTGPVWGLNSCGRTRGKEGRQSQVMALRAAAQQQAASVPLSFHWSERVM